MFCDCVILRLAVVAAATEVVVAALVDRLTDSEVQAQHRLRLMRTIPKQELSEAAVTKASCRRLRSVGPRTDATLVVVRIDMRLVLAITVD
jgi:hypothetical protein